MSNIIFNSNGNTTVKLLKVGNPFQITITANNSSYQIGQEIALSNNDSVEFEIASGSFSKDDMNYYQFVITGTGTVSLSGSLSEVTNAYQYYNLFKDCDKITDASNLTFTGTAAKGFCFSNMFANCTALVTPPSILPATTLDDWCYQGMFAGCTNLTGVPALPASVLADYCYYAMFYGCEKLKDSPTLNAQSLEDWCYNSMFYKCKSLSSITCELTGFTPENATSSWVFGIAAEGQFINSNTIEQYGTSKIPSGWTEIHPEPPTPPVSNDPLTFTSTTDNNTVKLSKNENPYSNTFYYSKNGGEWTAYELGTNISFDTNETVAFSGTSDHLNKSDFDLYYFKVGGESNSCVKVYGNVMSLVNGAETMTDDYQFAYLFSNIETGDNNNKIADASGVILPSTNITPNCFKNMFRTNDVLTAGPALPAMDLAPYCYSFMFYGCSSISSAPSLPATGLANNCYESMFTNCSHLTGGAEIYADTIQTYSCKNMFYGCTSLSSYTLSATNILTAGCYQMFSGAALLSAELFATNIALSGCRSMFHTCRNLKYMKTRFTDWGNPNSTYQFRSWVYNVQTSNGTFIKNEQLSARYGTDYIPQNWTVEDIPTPPTSDGPLTFTGKSASNAVALNKNGSPDAISLQYSKNNGTWTDYSWDGDNGQIIELDQNDTVAFSGNNDHFSKAMGTNYNFVMTGSIEAKGNIQSLMNYSDSCTSSCYYALFSGCTSLIAAPNLPATGLASHCYDRMFDHCSSLITVMSALPAMDLAPYCYGMMFANCPSLSTTPSLPATGLTSGCYSWMFWNCSELLSVELPATTLDYACYSWMFYGCSSLSSIEVNITEWSTSVWDNTHNWVDGVALTGTFTKPADLPLSTGIDYIPEGWTVVDK